MSVQTKQHPYSTTSLETTRIGESSILVVDKSKDQKFLGMEPGPARVLHAFSASTAANITQNTGRFWKIMSSNIQGIRARYAHLWPKWCYLPSYHWTCSLGHGLLLERALTVAKTYGTMSVKSRDYLSSIYMYMDTLACLGGWRLTKGVYKFDETLWESLTKTPITGDLPSDIFLCLPEWVVYVELPDNKGRDSTFIPIFEYLAKNKFTDIHVHGFFAYLDYDRPHKGLPITQSLKNWQHIRQFFNDNKDEVKANLVIMLNTETYQASSEVYDVMTSLSSRKGGGNFPLMHRIVISLGDWPLNKGLESMLNLMSTGDSEYINNTNITAETISPFVSALLYICSANAEIVDRATNRTLKDIKTSKKSQSMSIPGKVREWDVGKRIGSIVRLGNRQISDNLDSVNHDANPDKNTTKVRPHWRKAHWSTYWTGPKSSAQTPVVKWIPPVLVNGGQLDISTIDKLPEVIHRVAAPTSKMSNKG